MANRMILDNQCQKALHLGTPQEAIGRVLDFPQRLQGSLSFGTAHYFSPGKGIKGHFGGIIGFLG